MRAAVVLDSDLLVHQLQGFGTHRLEPERQFCAVRLGQTLDRLPTGNGVARVNASQVTAAEGSSSISARSLVGGTVNVESIA